MPLSDLALEVLEPMKERSTGPNSWVFPSTHAGATGAHVGRTSDAVKKLCRRLKIEDTYRPHAFRQTFADIAGAPVEPEDEVIEPGLGVDEAIIDAVLGHKLQTVGQKHYRSQQSRAQLFIKEKRDALEKWGTFVAGLGV